MGGRRNSDADAKKRKIPTALQELLKLDAMITNQFCSIADQILPQLSRTHYKALEISCHGMPWLTCWIAFIFLSDDAALHQMQVNFLIGFFLDILAVGVLKAATRRRRPATNESDMFMTVGVDKFSFPSGHASRASFVSHFFLSNFDVPLLLKVPLMMWSSAVCVSRLLLRRHHVLDVLAGFVLGIIESWVIYYIWLSSDTCSWLVTSLSF